MALFDRSRHCSITAAIGARPDIANIVVRRDYGCVAVAAFVALGTRKQQVIWNMLHPNSAFILVLISAAKEWATIAQAQTETERNKMKVRETTFTNIAASSRKSPVRSNGLPLSPILTSVRQLLTTDITITCV